MTDTAELIERLRNADAVDWPNSTETMCDEAATALETLRAEGDRLRTLPRETLLAMLEAFYKDEMPDMLGMIPDMQDAATALADALESQHD